jgi:hypothetical protein
MSISSKLRRWLYRGGRPNRVARVADRLTAALSGRGLGPDHLVTLEVTGRTSGRTVSLPLVVAEVDGQRYLVSMLGQNVNWVRNVRAAQGRAWIRHGVRRPVRLEEVDPALRAPVLKAYLQCAPNARTHLPVGQDAPLAEFARVAARFPVFRVVSAGTGSGTRRSDVHDRSR